MAIDMTILLLVTDTDAIPESQERILRGFDFGPVFKLSSQQATHPLYAINHSGRCGIAQPHLKHIHKFNKGWSWVTTDIGLYPAPPFLLTDNPDMKLIHNCLVTVHPTADALSLILGELHHYGKFNSAVLGTEWFGELSIKSGESTQGTLIAFSHQLSCLPVLTENVLMPDNDEVLGGITVNE